MVTSCMHLMCIQNLTDNQLTLQLTEPHWQLVKKELKQKNKFKKKQI